MCYNALVCFESEQLSISDIFIKSVVNFQVLSYGEIRVRKIYFPGTKWKLMG